MTPAWPRGGVVAALGALAVAVAAQELLLPGWTAHVSPAVLALVIQGLAKVLRTDEILPNENFA